MANWACLPHDLLLHIVGLVKKYQDFAAFGAVCKSWHASANKEEYVKALWLQQRTPYLMLTVRDGSIRNLYILAEGEIVASVRVPNLDKRKCYESLGWFLAVEKNGSMCLLDPFSRDEIPLPHQNTLPNFKLRHPYQVVKKMVLSARPSENSNFVVALIFRCIVDIAFWRPGDTTWRRIRDPGCMYEDITYHAGNFYSVDESSIVKIFNILEGYPREGHVIARLVADMHNDYHVMMELLANKNVYIVKTSDSLLLVARTVFRRFGEISRTRKFQVYEFHMSSLSTWREIDNLGNLDLFVGSEKCFNRC